MDESQLIIDYTPPTWRGWLFELLDCSVEYLLLLIVFGVLLGLATGRVYQSPFGPMHLDMLVFFGLMLVQIEIMMWSLLVGIVEVISAWALWLTPPRAVLSGLVTGAVLWWLG